MKSNNQFRQSVSDFLILLSSKEQQLKFQQQSPTVNIALELLCLWYDVLYNQDSPVFNRSFTPDELASIQTFNLLYNARKGQVPETIEQLHHDDDWDNIFKEAKELLKELS